MNRAPKNGDGLIVPYAGFPCPEGFEPSWAGEFAAPDPTVPPLFCLASLDGRLLFTNEDFSHTLPENGPGTGSKEAINGVARLASWVSVSTRQEVIFWATDNPRGRYLPRGAHGVTATSSGYFLAPLGQAGILTAKPADNDVALTSHKPGDGGLYIYRLITLRSPTGDEIIACAARERGLVAGVFAPTHEANPMKIAAFPGVDLIDLCSLSPGTHSLAVAALGRDGSIILCRDIMNDRQTRTFKFSSVKGVAYRILCHAGDLYVLTSEGLFVLGRLGSQFFDSERTESITTQIMPLPLDAIDMNLAWGRWLLVVAGVEVLRFDVNAIHDFVPAQVGNGEIREFHSTAPQVEPRWTDATSTSQSLALAG